ncbi:MAG: META domain-containing protein [Alteromonadaceae bacterium]|nr:META domain-containing protein [Alteromonadaceae bacterium]
MRLLFLSFFILLLSGCTASRLNDTAKVSQPPLNGVWQVEDIDAGGVIDFSMVTMDFTADDRVAGTTGCNQYTAGLEVDGDKLSVTQIVTTRRACAPALNNQEQRFLAALQSVTTVTYVQDTWLIMKNAGREQRLKLIRLSNQTHPPQDTAKPKSNNHHLFVCDAGQTLFVAFVGPETIRLTLNDEEETLRRERSASGAKYSNADMVFWNKGSEAMLQVKGSTFHCMAE